MRLHAEPGQQAVAALLQAVGAVLRAKGYAWDNATIEFLKALLLSCVTERSPAPDPKNTDRGQSADEDRR